LVDIFGALWQIVESFSPAGLLKYGSASVYVCVFCVLQSYILKHIGLFCGVVRLFCVYIKGFCVESVVACSTVGGVCVCVCVRVCVRFVGVHLWVYRLLVRRYQTLLRLYIRLFCGCTKTLLQLYRRLFCSCTEDSFAALHKTLLRLYIRLFCSCI